MFQILDEKESERFIGIKQAFIVIVIRYELFIFIHFIILLEMFAKNINPLLHIVALQRSAKISILI